MCCRAATTAARESVNNVQGEVWMSRLTGWQQEEKNGRALFFCRGPGLAGAAATGNRWCRARCVFALCVGVCLCLVGAFVRPSGSW